jgi:uncharacterized protein with PIN domain
MKFYTDENVDPAVATGLRVRGIDAITTQEAGRRGAGDDQQIEFAVAESRVIVTHNVDLLRMHSRGLQHAGIAFIGAHRKSLGEIIRMLVLLHDVIPADLMRNRVEYL